MPLPAEAMRIAQPKAWPQCTSYLLYSDQNYAAARRCAWEERLAYLTWMRRNPQQLNPPQKWISEFGGSSVLAVLYANSEGVARNIPLSIRLTCELDEWEKSPTRMELLQAMKDDPSYKEEISVNDMCDSSGGVVTGRCAEYDAQVKEHHRERELRRLTKGWSAPQKSKFAQLVKAKEDYAVAQGIYAGDFAGTLRAWYAIHGEETVREAFLANLKRFEAGQLPANSQEEYKTADAELNRVYRKKLSGSDDNAEENSKADERGDIKAMAANQPEYLRNLERSWLKYRHAWIDFARLRYPSIGKYAWLTLFTTEQTANLRNLQLGG